MPKINLLSSKNCSHTPTGQFYQKIPLTLFCAHYFFFSQIVTMFLFGISVMISVSEKQMRFEPNIQLI